MRDMRLRSSVVKPSRRRVTSWPKPSRAAGSGCVPNSRLPPPSAGRLIVRADQYGVARERGETLAVGNPAGLQVIARNEVRIERLEAAAVPYRAPNMCTREAAAPPRVRNLLSVQPKTELGRGRRRAGRPG